MGVPGELYEDRKYNELLCAWQSLECAVWVGGLRTQAAKARSINLHLRLQEQLRFSSPTLALFI